MHAPPRRRGADGLRGEVNPLQAVCGGARRQAGTNACRVRAMRRISPSCRQARSCRVLPRRNGGIRTRGLAAPSRARCRLRHIPFARRPGLEPGSTVLETAVLAIAPPTQREASMTPRAWPPGPSDGQASRTPPESPEPDSNRRPAAYEAAALPLGHRGLDGPSHRFFQCIMRVCSHGCLVRRATGGTVWWSRRDSDPRPSRCERDALPLRHGPMPAPTYARTGWKRSHSGGGVTPLVPSAGFEPATPTLGGWRSIP